jgi:hypothetical protein
MALHMRLMVNDRQVGYLVVQRRRGGPDRPQGDDVCGYDWRLNLDGKTLYSEPESPLAHRFGDGAWVLVARVLDAAGYGLEARP